LNLEFIEYSDIET
jgi:predicted alpha/beta hydrolase